MNLEGYLSRQQSDDDDVAMETRVARKDYRFGRRARGRVWEQDDVMAGDKKRDTFLTASNKL